MEPLPSETIYMVSEYLDIRSLASFSSCCIRLHHVLLARLYCTLKIKYGEKGADTASLKLIRTFQESQTCRQLLRHIEILGSPHHPWVWEPIFRPMCLAITGVIQTLPQSTLTSFTWKLGCVKSPDVLFHVPRCISTLHLETTLIDHSALFPDLKELSCKQLSTAEDIAWMSWHIRRQCLRKLSLGLITTSVDPVKVFGLLAYPQPSLASLTHLTLERMDVSEWPFELMSSLKCLTLQHCVQVDIALKSILRSHNNQLLLRELSISMLHEPPGLVVFLSGLSKRVQLERLLIRTAGGHNRLPSSCVLMFQDSLRHLELESLSVATDLRSVYLYSIDDIAQITTNCRLLRTLSVPMDIGANVRKLWCASLTPKCNLLRLHNRCHRDPLQCGRLRQAKADARLLSRPFVRAGHGSLCVVIGNEQKAFSWTISSGPAKKRHSILRIERNALVNVK